MSHRAKLVNGVKHSRGCACPTCDPQQSLLARRREEARAARAAPPPAISPHVAAARYVARAYARRPSDPPSADSKRFIELLRAGHHIRAATLATVDYWRATYGAVPPALRTEIDGRAVRRKRDPGRCFRRAGWRVVGVSASHRHRGALVLEAPL